MAASLSCKVSGDLLALFRCLEAPVQARVRSALLALHRFWPGMPAPLRWAVLGAALSP